MDLGGDDCHTVGMPLLLMLAERHPCKMEYAGSIPVSGSTHPLHSLTEDVRGCFVQGVDNPDDVG
jgi:hypothetical protein